MSGCIRYNMVYFENGWHGLVYAVLLIWSFLFDIRCMRAPLLYRLRKLDFYFA